MITSEVHICNYHIQFDLKGKICQILWDLIFLQLCFLNVRAKHFRCPWAAKPALQHPCQNPKNQTLTSCLCALIQSSSGKGDVRLRMLWDLGMSKPGMLKKRDGWVKDTPVFFLLPPSLPNPFLQTSSSNRFSTPSPTPFFITLSQPLY